MANIITVSNAKIITARAHAISHALIIALVCIFATVLMPSAKANAQTKTLKLYYLHTGEKNKITYYRNGKYISSALKKINWALRDWRRNEPTKMDPKLLDLVWEAYRRSGSKAYIHVISGYRSPVTNEKLRKRGGGQAKRSQHTVGKALDFFLPDVKVSKMRSIGLKMGVGGVGYYPRSGSPFVHLDTGSVRHWPRMTRKQLAKVFPSGKTMHIPTDGKPLAKYKVAVAEYKRRGKKGGKIATVATGKKDLNFFQRLAARASADENEGSAQSAPILPRAVKSIKAPVPTPAPSVRAAIKPIVGTSGGPAEIEVSGPLSITQPVPTSQTPPAIPEEPQPKEPQREFAILAERKVPFPISSPRNAITPTSNPQDDVIIETQVTPVAEEIVVAELTPEKPIATAPSVEPEILDPVDTVEIPQTQIETEELATTQDFTIPTPVKRPQFNNEPEEVQLASLDTVEETPEIIEKTVPQQVLTTLNQPALTANEIEDLRRSATPKIAPALIPKIEPSTPISVPQSPTTKTIAAKESDLAPIIVAKKVEEKSTSNVQLALADEGLRSADNIATNKAIAAIEDVTKNDSLVEPIVETFVEPLDETPADIPVVAPVESPAETKALTQEQEIEQEAEIIVALNNIPLPIKNPRFTLELAEQPNTDTNEIVSTSLDPDTFATQVGTTPSNSGLGKRTVSLDKFSAPQENKSEIGQYALANTFSIRDLNAVQAPAYGRNMIRKTPTAVFVDGFRSNVNQSANNGFSGKAIVFKKFARLTK